MILKFAIVKLVYGCIHVILASSVYTPNDINELLTDLDKPIPLKNVSGVLLQKAHLPCDIKPKQDDDTVFMVLWFKDTEAEPIYSYDVRNRPHNMAKFWSSSKVFGKRATFHPVPNPARLSIDNIQLEDESVYRCRVDFKNSPTRNTKVNFTVVVLPGRPVVYDSNEEEVETVLEAQNEDTVLSLTCEVNGGRPSPEVLWYLDGKLLDSTYEKKSATIVTNKLNPIKLTRYHSNAQLTCQANNTVSATPSSRLVFLKVNMKPLSVEILDKGTQLSVDKEYELECLAKGSKPTAQLIWTVADRIYKHLALKYPNGENQVISILRYAPKIEDHGKELVCTALNPSIPNSGIEDRWTLNIHYVPRVSLRIGHGLNTESIKEGDDVYFECNVKANPKIFKHSWYHNGEEIHQNVTARIIVADKSLVLQKVTKDAAGNYTCSAINTEGKGSSNSVSLRIMYAPSCKLKREQLYGALKQETVVLKCEVDSNPKPSEFHWTFNNSGDTSLVSSSRFTHSGYVSIINYTPVTDMDYGTLACWARNPIGNQKKPCLYQVVAAGRPFPLINCSIMNQTDEALQVQCSENFDGGLPQSFLMELLEMPHLQPTFNVTLNQPPPYFTLHGIKSSSSYKVKLYAVNAKGFSDPVFLETSSFKGAAKYTSSTTSKVNKMVNGLMSAVVVTSVLLIVSGMCLILYKCRRKFRRQRANGKPTTCSKDNDYITTVLVNSSETNSNNGGPDIITNIRGRSYRKDNSVVLPPDDGGEEEEEDDGNGTGISGNEKNFVHFSTSNGSTYNRSSSNSSLVVVVNKPGANESSDYPTRLSSSIIPSTIVAVSAAQNKQDTFVVQPLYSHHRVSPEVVTSSPKLQESCI